MSSTTLTEIPLANKARELNPFGAESRRVLRNSSSLSSFTEIGVEWSLSRRRVLSRSTPTMARMDSLPNLPWENSSPSECRFESLTTSSSCFRPRLSQRTTIVITSITITTTESEVHVDGFVLHEKYILLGFVTCLGSLGVGERD